MADISKIVLPSGSSYDIKDAAARDAIAKINSFDYAICKDADTTPAGVKWFQGDLQITGTLVASAATKSKIYLVPAKNASGNSNVFAEYITVEATEGVYTWELFGDTEVRLEDLGALASKDSASGSYTPEGTIAAQAFTGTEATITVSGTAVGTISTGSGEANYTPAGSVTSEFTGSALTSTGKFTPAGSIGTGSGDVNYTPAGSLSGGALSVTLTKAATKFVAESATAGGSVDTEGVAAQCTLPTLETSVVDETLTLSWSAGSFTPNVPTVVTMPTFAAQTIATDVATATISELPSFVGSGVELAFTGTQNDVSVTGTPAGTVASSFTGTGTELVFNGSANDSTGTYTPAGTVDQAVFTGKAATITVE